MRYISLITILASSILLLTSCHHEKKLTCTNTEENSYAKGKITYKAIFTDDIFSEYIEEYRIEVINDSYIEYLDYIEKSYEDNLGTYDKNKIEIAKKRNGKILNINVTYDIDKMTEEELTARSLTDIAYYNYDDIKSYFLGEGYVCK